eukprot:TRINITY_DN79577_c0_g1_i1.p1 TRINITY_DN79577_c0_g1~~TRINITY_DN79577_c0_g1_i1.p1  ORF type:complete len:401 (-),score=60.50 TRINITY_DN79577_c0_g1_i1:26-1228(-)
MDETADALEWGNLWVVLAPGLSMTLGSLFALSLRVPDTIQACTQNFSAGLLISAVASELYPLMSPPGLSPAHSSLAIAVGFAVGLAFMLGLEHLTEDDEEGEAPDERSRHESDISVSLLSDSEQAQALTGWCNHTEILKADVSSLSKSLEEGQRDAIDTVVHGIMNHVHQAERQLCLTEPLSQREIDRMKFHCGELKAQSLQFDCKSNLGEQRKALKAFADTLDHIHEHTERKKFSRWKPAPLNRDASFKEMETPWALVGSVTADGGVDGLLIGLAYAASSGAGWAMSIATCIEMGFLGLSYCATISNGTRSPLKRAFLVLLPPLALVVTGLIGTQIGDALRDHIAMFVSFIGFSTVCLLFLVTQELLAEAREVAGAGTTVTLMFFAGLLGGILLEKFVG